MTMSDKKLLNNIEEFKEICDLFIFYYNAMKTLKPDSPLWVECFDGLKQQIIIIKYMTESG